MFRRLPILLIIVMTASVAHAQQSFFDQFFGSLKTSGPAASELVGETAGPVPADSEPLALQPTVTRTHYKKRTHAAHRHHQASPEHRPQARTETHRVDREKTSEKTPPPSAAPSREVVRRPAAAHDVTPADDVVRPKVTPAEDEVAPGNGNVAPPVAWPDRAPAAVAPWPAERAPADTVQTAQPDEVINEPPLQALERRQDVTQAAQHIESEEPQSFMDKERYVLAGFSAAWLLLGIVMFLLRRPIANVIDARRRPILRAEYPRIPARLPAAPQLTLILANAERDEPVADNNEEELRGERRVVSAG